MEGHPEVYAKTAFILNYDEGGQFWDHAWAPTPPMPGYGISTVTVEGEVNSEVETTVEAPIGMGFRVPLLIASPWTRGNIVVSQVFDHTSVIQFIEERFNVSLPVISPWRRTVAGNLLSAFDFDHPDYSWPVFPDTSDYVHQSIEQCRNLPPPEIPANQVFPTQEQGTRISRALPYEFIVSDSALSLTDGSVMLDVSVRNTGGAGAAFLLVDNINLAKADPRHYTVEAGKGIVDHLSFAAPSGSSNYRATLVGANGFYRTFEGNAKESACFGASSFVSYDVEGGNVLINLANSDGLGAITFNIVDNAYALIGAKEVSINVAESTFLKINTTPSGNWYDFSVSVKGGNCYTRRFMGRMETGVDTISDPAMGAGVPAVGAERFPIKHNDVPEKLRRVPRNFFANDGNKDSVLYTDKIDF